MRKQCCNLLSSSSVIHYAWLYVPYFYMTDNAVGLFTPVSPPRYDALCYSVTRAATHHQGIGLLIYYSLMGSLSYKQAVVDQNVVLIKYIYSLLTIYLTCHSHSKRA